MKLKPVITHLESRITR